MLTYFKSVFSSDDCASFARWATAVTVLTSCGCLIFLVVKNHALPDGGALTGLSVFATAPYGVGKLAQTFLKNQSEAGAATGPISASAAPDHGRSLRPTLRRVSDITVLLALAVALVLLIWSPFLVFRHA